MERSSREKLKLLKFSELPKFIENPDFQRVHKKDIVDNIVNDLLNILQKKEEPILPWILVICKSSKTDEYWLVDGNHRYIALSELYNKTNKEYNPEIFCLYIKVKNEEEAENIFRIVNKSTPIIKMPKGVSRNIVTKIIEKLSLDYKKYFKESENCQRPYLNKIILEREIGKIASINTIKYDDFFKKLENINEEYSTKTCKFFDCTKDQLNKVNKNGNLFVGLKKNYDWLYEMYEIKRETEDSDEEENNKKRKKIPEYMKNRIYERDEHKCRICNRELYKDDIHISHIISHKNGGKEIEDNLVVLCQKCNTSLGSKDIPTYFKEQNREWKL